MRQLQPQLTPQAYQPSDMIRHCTLEGNVVVLDLREGKYLVFDKVASHIWNSLLDEPDAEQRIKKLAGTFNVPPSQCERDIGEFINSCHQRGLFRTTEGPEREPLQLPTRSASSLNAWRCLYATQHSLARSGFSATYEFHRRLVKPETSKTPDADSLRVALRAFNRAECVFPIRNAPNDCLPRSLALQRFLISTGINASHCIGVRRFPFGAHAWVEVTGKLVCDSDRIVSEFTEISRI